MILTLSGMMTEREDAGCANLMMRISFSESDIRAFSMLEYMARLPRAPLLFTLLFELREFDLFSARLLYTATFSFTSAPMGPRVSFDFAAIRFKVKAYAAFPHFKLLLM